CAHVGSRGGDIGAVGQSALGGLPFLAYFAYQRWRHGRGFAEIARRARLRLGGSPFIRYSPMVALSPPPIVGLWPAAPAALPPAAGAVPARRVAATGMRRARPQRAGRQHGDPLRRLPDRVHRRTPVPGPDRWQPRAPAVARPG